MKFGIFIVNGTFKMLLQHLWLFRELDKILPCPSVYTLLFALLL